MRVKGDVIELKWHHFFNKKVMNLKTNKIYTVENVVLNWFCGWYITLICVDDHNSHGVYPYQNICCGCDIINKVINDTQNYIVFIENK